MGSCPPSRAKLNWGTNLYGDMIFKQTNQPYQTPIVDQRCPAGGQDIRYAIRVGIICSILFFFFLCPVIAYCIGMGDGLNPRFFFFFLVGG